MSASPRPELGRFLRHLQDERGLSAHTVSAYRRDLDQLETFLSEYLARTTWRWTDPDVDRLAVRAFLGWCERKGLTRRTAARKLSAARAFFRFLSLDERIPADPTRAVRSPKIEKRLPGHLSRADARAVLEAAEERAAGNTLAATRALVVLEMLYGRGSRRSALHGIGAASRDRARREGRRLGKGNKERVAPVTTSSVRAIVRYLPRRAEVVRSGEGGLMVNASGGRLERRSIQHVVR